MTSPKTAITASDDAVSPPGPFIEELGRLASLSWPVSLGGMSMLAMGLVDTAMVGPLGEAALASLAAANLWIHGLSLLGRGLLMGMDPIVSQAHGRSDRGDAGAALRTGLWVAVAVGAALFAVMHVAEPGLRLLGQPGQLLAGIGAYSAAVAWGVPALMLYIALRQFLQGLGRMRPATVAVVWANVLNVALNAVLIHGAFGVPALGLVGAGWATAVSSWGMLVMLVWLERRVLMAALRGARPGPLLPQITRLLSFGVPVTIQLALEVWAFVAAGVFVGWMGQRALAAHQVAILLASLAFMIPLGIAGGATTRVGNLVGAGFAWQRSAAIAIAMGAAVMLASGTLFLVFPTAIVGLFIPEGPARDLAANLLPIAGAFALFDGIQVTCGGVLRGLGDVRVPVAINAVAYWLITVPMALWWMQGDGVEGVWSALVLGLFTAALLLSIRVIAVARRPTAPWTGPPGS